MLPAGAAATNTTAAATDGQARRAAGRRLPRQRRRPAARLPQAGRGMLGVGLDELVQRDQTRRTGASPCLPRLACRNGGD